MNDNNAAVAKTLPRLRLLRRAANLTQAQLAKTIGVHTITVNRWENGAMVPKSDVLLRLAEALACSIDDLFAALDAAA